MEKAGFPKNHSIFWGEGKARLILAQIDHVSGEITGFAIGKIMELGANNVQLIPTITKKNRPGSIIMIDVDAIHEEDIVRFLAGELSQNPLSLHLRRRGLTITGVSGRRRARAQRSLHLQERLSTQVS